MKYQTGLREFVANILDELENDSEDGTYEIQRHPGSTDQIGEEERILGGNTNVFPCGVLFLSAYRNPLDFLRSFFGM